MGGKTGSTELGGARPFDGLFAGLIFDDLRRPRYAVVTFVRRGGFGGGAAAQISATVGAILLRRKTIG
jgi:cell division protein FtsI/penicillin-binding protein 2